MVGSTPESRASFNLPRFQWRSPLLSLPSAGNLVLPGLRKDSILPESRSISWRTWKQIQSLQGEQDITVWMREEGAFQAEGSLHKSTDRSAGGSKETLLAEQC